MTSDKVPWAKVTITPEAVEKMSELAEEIERLRAELEQARLSGATNIQHIYKVEAARDNLKAEVERLRAELEQVWRDSGKWPKLWPRRARAVLAEEVFPEIGPDFAGEADENERLRKSLDSVKLELEAEKHNHHKDNEYLLLEGEKFQQGIADKQAEVERLRNLYDQADLARAQLELRVTRLRKAVNWLRGAVHQETHVHEQNSMAENDVSTCEQWECQRARAVLEEET